MSVFVSHAAALLLAIIVAKVMLAVLPRVDR